MWYKFRAIDGLFTFLWQAGSALFLPLKRMRMKIVQTYFLGALMLVFSACQSCNGGEETNGNGTMSQIPPPQELSYTLVKVHPHDTSFYTQGLQYLDGFLYEGSGNPDRIPNKSKLRKIDFATGKVVRETFIKDTLFGEGITIMGDKIYQLTWREKKGFVYNLADFKLVKEFTYNTDGWGLTNDGRHLIVSDGSDLIYYWDPATFKEIKRISVMDNTGLRNNINEMEYINGYIYANIYLTDEVVKIDPATGHVVGRMDFSVLKKSYPELEGPDADVLNGIAWDSTGNRLFITGKYWSKLFEVKLN